MGGWWCAGAAFGGAASGDSRDGTPARLTHSPSSPSPSGMRHLLLETMKKRHEVCSQTCVVLSPHTFPFATFPPAPPQLLTHHVVNSSLHQANMVPPGLLLDVFELPTPPQFVPVLSRHPHAPSSRRARHPWSYQTPAEITCNGEPSATRRRGLQHGTARPSLPGGSPRCENSRRAALCPPLCWSPALPPASPASTHPPSCPSPQPGTTATAGGTLEPRLSC